MIDFSSWVDSSETQKVLDEIEKKRTQIKNELGEQLGCVKSPDVAKEYILNVGILEGLRLAKVIINSYQEKSHGKV